MYIYLKKYILCEISTEQRHVCYELMSVVCNDENKFIGINSTT